MRSVETRFPEPAWHGSALDFPLDTEPVRIVPISELTTGESPRSGGVDEAHAQVLAESVEDLPPILVHRETMRVIDGAHRLRAAVLAGAEHIKARLFTGDDNGAFILGVRANIAHGLPLSLGDRKAAAARVLSAYPEWSDRAVATATGLSARTVSGLRARSTAEGAQLVSRVGLDGRSRPVNSTEGRRMASKLLTQKPDASIREIARATGISPGTVKDVRDRMHRGADPVPAPRRSGQQTGDGRSQGGGPWREPVNQDGLRDVSALSRGVRRDPSLRFTDAGRLVLRWLDANSMGSMELERLVEELPPHTAGVIAELARSYAAHLTEFATRLERRPPAAD